MRRANGDLASVLKTATARTGNISDDVDASRTDRGEVERLQREVDDLKIMLETATAHADIVEAELYEKHAEISLLYSQLSGINRELHALANSDGLTGVANRRRFDEVFAQEWRRHCRQSVSLALVLLDIDYFKAYNDAYGHVVGDDCLRQLAVALTRTVERPADLIARYGGEEFAILLPETQLAGALHVAENVRQAIASLHIPHVAAEGRAWVTASMGAAATVPTAHIAPETLVAIADRALYDAKACGRNRAIGVEF